MKNLLLTIAVVISGAFQMTANSGLTASSIVVLDNEKSVLLDLNGTLQAADAFTITDVKNNIVFSETIKKHQANVQYNLEHLPYGKYEIKIEGADFVEYHEILVSNSQVDLISKESYFRPFIRKSGDKIRVNALFPSKENVQLNILDETGALVYSYSDLKSSNYGKVFNLENLDTGNYTVIVSTNHFSSSKKISL